MLLSMETKRNKKSPAVKRGKARRAGREVSCSVFGIRRGTKDSFRSPRHEMPQGAIGGYTGPAFWVCRIFSNQIPMEVLCRKE